MQQTVIGLPTVSAVASPITRNDSSSHQRRRELTILRITPDTATVPARVHAPRSPPRSVRTYLDRLLLLPTESAGRLPLPRAEGSARDADHECRPAQFGEDALERTRAVLRDRYAASEAREHAAQYRAREDVVAATSTCEKRRAMFEEEWRMRER
ncbi:hypothetical protein BD413DRAFT_494927 [Trametes elegans]|nr:hypothetical protein BD413DRAFT_494927 [Trametes elegans]